MNEQTISLCKSVQDVFNNSRTNWKFGLSANQIINLKIPNDVVGSTGVCKVFCKFARDAGLDCFVVLAADVEHLSDDRNIINGAQFIAVESGGELRAFSPTDKKCRFFTMPVKIGEKFLESGREYVIVAIIQRDDIEKIHSYQDLRDLYTNVQM